MFHRWIGALVGLAMMGMAGSANATLIGDQIEFQGFFPDLGTPLAGFNLIVNVVDGTGDEFVFGVSTTNVESGSVIFTLSTGFATGDDCNCIQITSMDWVGDPSGIISGITLSSNTITGFTTANVTTSAVSGGPSEILINVADLTGVTATGSVTINLQTTDREIPEPGSLALFGIGLVGLGFMTRRRRNRRRQN